MFTLAHLLDAFRTWFPLIFSAFTFWWVQSRNSNKEFEAKVSADKKKVEDRLHEIEAKQTKNVPKFEEMVGELKLLSSVVHNKHELRFTGIVSDIDKLRDNYDLRFLHNEKTMDSISKQLDDLETKIDKNAEVMGNKVDKIFDEILKLNKGR